MSTQIWKYFLPVEDKFTIEMPFGAKILHVDKQGIGGGHIWVKVESRNSVEVREFRTIGTGHPIKEKRLQYLGTYQMNQFVWHIFEKTK